MSTVQSTPAETFLTTYEGDWAAWARPVGVPEGLAPDSIFTGGGALGFEVALATAAAPPKMDAVRKLWRLRWAKRPNPTLLIVAYPVGEKWEATVCGTEGDPAAVAGLALDQVERMCTAVLSEPDSSKAKRTYERLLAGTKDQLITGLSNQGLFASHELRAGVPARSDWSHAQATGKSLLTRSREDLMRGLGYTLVPHGSTAYILTTSQTRHAVAILLDEEETFDRPSIRFSAASPVAKGIAVAQAEHLPWLIVTRGTQIRLYPTKPDVGVGRKGQTETYVELDLATLNGDDAGYLPLLFSSSALEDGGSVTQILAASVDHAVSLGKRLRERVYNDVVPQLAVAIANRMTPATGTHSAEALAEAYHRTLIVLFRLLFVAYAEDRGLLPYQRNPRYTKKALKTFARDYANFAERDFDPAATDLWDDLLAVWQAVDDGNTDWNVPAYNGGLFAADKEHPDGLAIRAMRLTNAEVGPALQALLIDIGEDGHAGPVDFRSLSVREFGTLYEGLLESSLSVAVNDLAVDPKTLVYLPAKSDVDVEVRAGEVYFHNASGARKATGSYFTKEFAVEHLLDTVLDPAISDHLANVADVLERGDSAGAAGLFFDFRIADLAMGSGHFLVAAVDRTESRFAAFLANNPIPGVNNELTELAQVARDAVQGFAGDVEIEPSSLLRRQIARRCIYGVDINQVAVELARLALWIHTFVPGLPMSSLDHGLVAGNSLTGIGSLAEALDAMRLPNDPKGQDSLFREPIERALDASRKMLVHAANSAEATKSEVRDASRERRQARLEASDALAIFDAAVGVRLGISTIPFDVDSAIAAGRDEKVLAVTKEQACVHLPYQFPEVFMRDNPGFDVVLGNPPWDEVTVEEPRFWQRSTPGILGLPAAALKKRIAELRRERPDLVAELREEQEAAERQRDILMKGPYPGLTKGDVDLYKAFAWRDWISLRAGGRMGVVFPRSVLNGAGSAAWREHLLASGRIDAAITLTNTGKWVFDEIHGQYTVALLSVTKTSPGDDAVVRIAGPFHSHGEFVQGSTLLGEMPAKALLDWGNGAAFPLLPSGRAAAVFATFRDHPRLDTGREEWDFRAVREFDATTDRPVFDAGQEQAGRWPVYTGGSFNLWEPDAGSPYTWADERKVRDALFNKRKNQARTKSSAFFATPQAILDDPKTLACLRPRVAFRDITNQTNSRTVIACLVPPQVVLTNTAPYILENQGGAAMEAYLLGVLSSIPLDWYARRYVELHVNFHILNAFPIPRPEQGNPLRARVIEISARLAAVDARYGGWAAEVGVPVASVAPTEQDTLVAELDALVGLLYGLSRSDMEHIFETFHRGWCYRERLDAVLDYYDQWEAMV